MDDIRYLKHTEINKEMWDACVINSSNGLIYARSWYLDAMSPDWEALIYKDYVAVMPLTVSKKMGIAYLSQPPFSQQLGIIGPLYFDNKKIQSFIDVACSIFALVEINLNFNNTYDKGTLKRNLVLDLGKPFEITKSAFRKDLISKAITAKLRIQSSHEFEKVINSFRKLYSGKIPHLREKHLVSLLIVCSHLASTGNLLVRSVLNEEDDLLANALFFKDERRIYYIMTAIFPEGRKYAANAFLLYEVIKEFSGSKYLFDFEGSSVPSINLFFKKFNPVEENYPIVRINNLSPILKKIKSIVG